MEKQQHMKGEKEFKKYREEPLHTHLWVWVNGDRYKGERHQSQKGRVTKEQMKGQD
jgi:hypothetical protein